MVSFARARTKSWLSKLWPVKVHSLNFNKAGLDDSIDIIAEQKEQNKSFFDASKSGGIWFS